MRSRLRYLGPAPLRANQLFRSRLEVALGREIVPGGRLVVAARHFSDFGDPQMDNPAAENYLRLEGGRPGSAWRVFSLNDYYRHPWNRGIDLQLTSGGVAAGEKIVIFLGGDEERSPGYRCQSFSERAFRFRLGVDGDGSGDWELAAEEEFPGLEIIGAPTSRISVTVPDMTRRQGPSRVCVKPEDIYGNIAGEAGGEVCLLLDDALPLARLPLVAGQATQAQLDLPRDERWHTLTAVSDDGRLFARSNPFGPSPAPGFHLYWGEIHSQSGLCDGTNHPAELYDYARTAVGLDFASVTSHDFELTPEQWEELKGATRAASEPGAFVTFLGYEWSGPTARGGDNNIYFLGDDGPLLYNGPCTPGSPWNSAEPYIDRTRTLAEVVEELRGLEAMIIPHCGGRRCNFDLVDPRLMPLWEIHSCHRNYEHLVPEVLRRGWRAGFIGGSDDHRGAPGDSRPAARDVSFSSPSGLVAAYARELTRESLWEAFFARRVYATNGKRIVLDFRINGTLMGGELRLAAGEPLVITVWARLDGLLDRIELVRGAETIRRLVGPWNRMPEFSAETSEPALPGVSSFYVRIVQTDGGLAWSSPIWVEAC